MSYASPFDCPRCGAPVRFSVVDKDEAGPVEECVAGCGVLPVVADWRDIPAVVAQVKRKRPLLSPKCFGRLHHRCRVSNCGCHCHKKGELDGAQA